MGRCIFIECGNASTSLSWEPKQMKSCFASSTLQCPFQFYAWEGVRLNNVYVYKINASSIMGSYMHTQSMQYLDRVASCHD